MFDKLLSLSDCTLLVSPQQSAEIVAEHQGYQIDRRQFNQDVCELGAVLMSQQEQHYALYYERAYPFAVSLFALLHSHKTVWIAGNNKAKTAEKLSDQGCLLLGEWQGQEQLIESGEKPAVKLEKLEMDVAQINIYTSGSSGQAKAISKTLQQFQDEIQILEQCWGTNIADAEIFATVSHQHIYGLLFRVLWPLLSGRCFHSDMFLSPEPMLKVINQKSAVWVASPAQLKRLDELSDWQQLTRLNVIFSSGGALPLTAAELIHQHSQQKVIEVYGSSETGGIAWRQSVDYPYWKLFSEINITIDLHGQGLLNSPYLNTNKAYVLDDKVKLLADNCFELLGRADRIVKVEEKRLSLDEMQQYLNATEWVEASYLLLLQQKRDKIAATLVLSDVGVSYFKQYGRAALIKQLRNQLMQGFETSVLPRKWLFMHALPLTAQGKINSAMLEQFFSLDNKRFPQVLSCQLDDNQVAYLQLRVLPSLVYFSGHFPQQPILPGVTQLAWVEQLGRILFDIALPFSSMEVIKFKKIIRPGDIVEMKLNWNAAKSKLYFETVSATESHSSGRIVYGEQG